MDQTEHACICRLDKPAKDTVAPHFSIKLRAYLGRRSALIQDLAQHIILRQAYRCFSVALDPSDPARIDETYVKLRRSCLSAEL